MNPGQFNRQIQFQEAQQGQSNRGGNLGVTYQTYWATNAMERPLNPSRNLEDNQTALQSVTAFTVRYRRDMTVTKESYILDMHTQKRYTIQSIVQVGDQRQYLEIRAALKQ